MECQILIIFYCETHFKRYKITKMRSGKNTDEATKNFSMSEKKQFQTMIDRYDSKQFTKAFEINQELVASHPDHAEALAFKALILMGLKKKDESLELMKEILKKDKSNFKNFTVWHVYGIIYRQNKQYKEARMSFAQALKIDDTNQNVLRDLANI